MKILVAVDQNPYSSHAVNEVAKLAANTWANVSLLGVQAKKISKQHATGNGAGLPAAGGPLVETLLDLRQGFLSRFDQHECPYAQADFNREFSEVGKGVYEALPVSADAKKNSGCACASAVSARRSWPKPGKKRAT